MASVPARTLAGSVGFSLLLGCAAAPSRSNPLSAAAIAAELDGASLEARAPGRSAPGWTAPTLEREAYVSAVLRQNPSLEAARQGVKAALARVHQAGSFEDPMLDLGVAPLSIGSKEARLGYEVALSQKLPWFGKRALEEAMSSAEAAAVRHDYEAMRRELALGAVTLYDRYFVLARSLEINREHVALMQAMKDTAIAQLATGRGSTQDALEAEAELTHMEHDALTLTAEREITVAQMNELLHRAPELPLPPPAKELALPGEPDRDSKRLAAEATAKRPEIRATRERARAEQARAASAEREAYPDITLSTSYGSMWDMPQHRWMVGVGLNLPLQSARRTGAGEEASAMRAQYESEAMRLGDKARTEVFVSLKRLEESKHVIALFETRLLPVARDQIDAARAGFATARSSFSTVIGAERNLRRVELEYQTARAEYLGRRAELDRALGRIPGLTAEEARK